MTEREKQEMNSGSDSKSEAPPHKMKKLNSEPTSRNLGQFLFFIFPQHYLPQKKKIKCYRGQRNPFTYFIVFTNPN